MSDMNPENNTDTFQGRGNRIKELEEENAEMKQLLKIILETDCLPHWAYEKDVVDEESIAEMVRKFVKK
jgi:hypothetical protein